MNSLRAIHWLFLVNFTPIDEGHLALCAMDVVCWTLKDILIDNDQVGAFAHF